eukprot:5852516-Prymnesium_polylepis.2
MRGQPPDKVIVRRARRAPRLFNGGPERRAAEPRAQAGAPARGVGRRRRQRAEVGMVRVLRVAAPGAHEDPQNGLGCAQ